ncbi:hypothetical protein HID58_046330 [Brassica napus]|uniref:Uncharacterized protein n=1 Tax=Brassica napus TaxID=3708 RepID=A0ABQ8AW61_BRANA|nr:hypothetical protein HID58_046330 [Brassica napus]
MVILPLSPWFNYVSRWLSSTADGALCRWLSANRSDEGIKSRLICYVEAEEGSSILIAGSREMSKGHLTKEYAASQVSLSLFHLVGNETV